MRLLASPFARKLLATLLGTVLLLAAGIGVTVNRETDRQVDEVSRRTVAQARASLERFEARERRFLDLRLAALTEGAPARAALEAFQAGNDSTLMREIEFEIDRFGLPDVLLAFHHFDGTTAWARTRDAETGGPRFWSDLDPLWNEADPFGLLPLTVKSEEMTDGREEGYRVVDGRVYRVQTHIEVEVEGGEEYVVGFVTDGFPIDGADLELTGGPTEVALCITDGARCILGTDRSVRRLDPLADLGITPETAGSEGRRLSAAGADWHVAFFPLVNSDGLALAVAVNLSPVLAPFQRIERVLFGVVAGSLLLAIVVAALMAKGLTEPVLRLTAATRRVADGDFDTSVEVESKDEIGALARAFNEMTEGLRLKERYRGVLQKVVAPQVAAELMEGEVVLGGETRVATVLFGDVRGFTAATQNAAPQEVIELLNDVMARLASAVDEAGGVVDKFVGDEIMAVFGAPVAHPDDAARALSAAAAMQRAMIELNRERSERGAPKVGLGIGVNTGEVVAGNMGSPERLNYTVLGSPVNLASRLCSAARAGDVLVGESTAAAVGSDDLEPLGEIELKGFEAPVAVHRLRVGPLRAAVTGIALALALAAGGGSGLAAQEWPELRDRAWWSNASGSVEAGLSGRLEIDGYATGEDGAGLLGPGEIFAPRARLFFDFFAGDDLHVMLEGRFDRGDVPGTRDARARIEQAWVRIGGGSVPVSLQLGRMPSPVGSYGERHLGPADPFIRPPVPFDQRTVMSDRLFPGSVDGFLQWREDPETFRTNGLPPIWQVPYPWGARLDVGRGTTGFHVALVNSAPSSVPSAWDLTSRSTRNPTVVVGARTAIGPAWRFQAWISRGPWLALAEEGPGQDDLTTYLQTLIGGQVEWRRGGTVARAELWWDEWQVRFATNPILCLPFRELPWSVELQQDLRPGLYVAGRVGGLDFLEADHSEYSGLGPVEWDDDFVRFEAAVGYRLARNAGLVAEVSDGITEGVREARDRRLSLRLWWDL